MLETVVKYREVLGFITLIIGGLVFFDQRYLRPSGLDEINLKQEGIKSEISEMKKELSALVKLPAEVGRLTNKTVFFDTIECLETAISASKDSLNDLDRIMREKEDVIIELSGTIAKYMDRNGEVYLIKNAILRFKYGGANGAITSILDPDRKNYGTLSTGGSDTFGRDKSYYETELLSALNRTKSLNDKFHSSLGKINHECSRRYLHQIQ